MSSTAYKVINADYTSTDGEPTRGAGVDFSEGASPAAPADTTWPGFRAYSTADLAWANSANRSSEKLIAQLSYEDADLTTPPAYWKIATPPYPTNSAGLISLPANTIKIDDLDAFRAKGILWLTAATVVAVDSPP